MTAIRKRRFARMGTALALSTVSACGSAAPARPVALDPSNPDAPGSPRAVARPDAAETPANAKSDGNADMPADAGATPVQPEPHHHGSGTHPGKSQ